MPGMDVEQLNIRIQSDSTAAVNALDNLINKLERLQSIDLSGVKTAFGHVKAVKTGAISGYSELAKSIEKIGSALSTHGSAFSDLQRVSSGLQNFADSMPKIGDLTQLVTLADSLSKLGKVDGQKLFVAGEALKVLTLSLNSLQVDPNTLANIQAVAQVLTSISSKTGKRYSTDFQALATGLNQLFQVLARAPTVSTATIQTLQAVGNLNAESVKAAGNMVKMSASAERYAESARRSSVSTHSFTTRLAFAIGKFRQIYFVIRRLVSVFGNMVESAMDYVETLNYFSAAFDQVASRSIDAFGNAGQEAGSAFTNRFAQEAEKLTEKMSGYAVDASGMVRNTGMTTLGLNPERMMNYQATFAQMASSMGVASDVATDLSRALTEIGADLASVKNMDFESTWENLQSGLVGMSRAVDKYGLNIRNVNLQQKLTELGIEANIQAMNQQDKALLRTIIILENSQYAWGDLSDTLQQPANQLRMLRSGIQNLGRTIGNLFMPIIAAALPYVNAFVVALQRMLEVLIDLIGIDFDWASVGGAAGVNSEWADYLDDTADGFTNATAAAKEWQNQLLGFDEINKLGSESSDDSSSSAGNPLITGQLEGALRAALDRYQRVWDESYNNVSNQVNEIAERIIGWFGRLKTAAQPTLDALSRLWNEVLKPLGLWKWEALKDFYERFLKPVGEWVLGEGIPKLVEVLIKLYNDIDWGKFKSALQRLWDVLKPFTIGVFDGFIKFCEALEPLAALTFNAVIDVFTAIGDTLSKLDPETLELLGQILGVVMVGGAASKMLGLGKVIAPLVGKGAAAASAASTATAAAPAATALFTKPVFMKTLGSAVASYVVGNWVTGGYRERHATNTKSKGKNTWNLLGEWGTAISAASGAGAISGAGVGSAIPGIGTLVGAVAGIGAGLVGTMFTYRDSTGKTAGDYIKSFGQSVYSSVLNSLGIKVPQAVQTSANNVRQALGGSNGGRGFAGSFKSGLEETNRVVQQGINGGSGISGSFRTGLATLQTTTTSGVNGVFGGIKSLINTHTPTVNELIAAAGRAAAQKAQEAGTSARTSYANGMSGLGADVDKQLSQVKDRITKARMASDHEARTSGHSFKESFKSGLSTLASDVSNIISGLNNTISSALNYNTVKSSLGGVITAFRNTFGEAANAAIGQYNSMAGNMSTATINKNRALSFSKVPSLAYANGGFPEDGFFFANSTEMVGRFANGRTAVANNEQIIAGIEGGVARGMAQALMSSASVTGGQNGQPVQVVINVDSETLYRTTLRGQNKYNSRYHLQLG